MRGLVCLDDSAERDSQLEIEGDGAMSRTLRVGLAILLALSAGPLWGQAQEENCRLLDSEASRRFLPDRVPMEA